MRYLVFQNRRINGPYEPADLARLPGFSAETLVCPEDLKGNRQADWQKAAAFPTLSALVAGDSEETLEANSSWGTPFAALVRQAASQSAAALGKTRDQIAALEEAVARLEEGLRLKDDEAASLRAALEARAGETAAAREGLGARIGEIEGALARVETSLRESLGKDAAALRRLESSAQAQARALEGLAAELSSLKEGLQSGAGAASDESAARAALQERVDGLEESRTRLEKGLAELSGLKEGLGKAPAGSPGLEAAVESQASAIEETTRAVLELKRRLDDKAGPLEGAAQPEALEALRDRITSLEAGLAGLPDLRREIEKSEAMSQDAEKIAETLALAVEELKAAKEAPGAAAQAPESSALNGLKDKVASLEDAVSRLEEGLGLAGGELASLREGLEKRSAVEAGRAPAPDEAALGALREKLAALDSAVSRLDEGLRLKAGEITLLRTGMDQAAAAGKGAEAAAVRLARAVEDLKALQAAAPPAAPAAPPAAASAPAPAPPLTLKIELSPRSGMIKPPEPAAPASAEKTVNIPPGPPSAPEVPKTAPIAADKTVVLPPAPPPAAPAAEPDIPKEVSKERIRQVAVLYARGQDANRDTFIKFLRDLSQQMSKSKSLYLRQVFVAEVAPGADLKSLAKRIHESGAGAVLAVLTGLPEPLLASLSRLVKQTGLLFENIAPEDVQKKARAVDVLADLMLLSPHA